MDVNKVVEWLNTAADHMENKQFKMVMRQAARIMGFQKQSLEAVTKANGTMAEALSKYLDAEQKKRLYLFPCAPGQQVFVITSCVGIMDVNGGEEDFVECPFEATHDCPIHNRGECGECTNTMAVFPDTVEYLIVDKDGQTDIVTKHTGGFTPDQIGTELFFDKDQAEKKLEEMKHGKTD